MICKEFLLGFLCMFFFNSGFSQDNSSSDVLHEIKKLGVFGNVLYIAAHPDDENTRLLSYLANEKLYRTGYLSLTRGDGGQNLIGDEQGIDLGMIRTHELLAARSVDGAEQFFTRAYDFGYSKSPAEALRIWGHDKILEDVVYAIRKFRPDVIICRFPSTGEGGHGHHTASAILAAEAFDAAADKSRFPEQLRTLTTWKAKRLLWNTFNFGGNNTQRESQFKIDVGLYNPLLGKSYGEMAAESRSKHSSQGFGVPAQRGTSFEYFETIKGEPPVKDLFDGIEVSPSRLTFAGSAEEAAFKKELNELQNNFSLQDPAKSVPALLRLLKLVKQLPNQDNSKYLENYAARVTEVILKAGGIFAEVVAKNQLNIIGDSATFAASFNNRLGLNVSEVQIRFAGADFKWPDAPANQQLNASATIKVPLNMQRGNPFWLEGGLPNGAFTIASEDNRIDASVNAHVARGSMLVDGEALEFEMPVRYKFTEPTKGEIYQPVYFTDAVNITAQPGLLLTNAKVAKKATAGFQLKFNKAVKGKIVLTLINGNKPKVILDTVIDVAANKSLYVPFELQHTGESGVYKAELSGPAFEQPQVYALRKISYSHIPDIVYQYRDSLKIISADISISGKRVGYINGAGDKVPEALRRMGYVVDILEREDINANNLRKYDAIVTGIRAFNVHEWLASVQFVLMKYVEEGGVMLVQYNTNSNAGPLRTKVSPFPFSISRSRITDEGAEVKFIAPGHAVLNYPNKISATDFEGWLQERSVYHAENTDPAFMKILSMKDPGEKEKEHDGSLIVAEYGRGRYIYTGLAFFRQLPAGVPGAYRLMANLLAAPQNKK